MYDQYLMINHLLYLNSLRYLKQKIKEHRLMMCFGSVLLLFVIYSLARFSYMNMEDATFKVLISDPKRLYKVIFFSGSLISTFSIISAYLLMSKRVGKLDKLLIDLNVPNFVINLAFNNFIIFTTSVFAYLMTLIIFFPAWVKFSTSMVDLFILIFLFVQCFLVALLTQTSIKIIEHLVNMFFKRSKVINKILILLISVASVTEYLQQERLFVDNDINNYTFVYTLLFEQKIWQKLVIVGLLLFFIGIYFSAMHEKLKFDDEGQSKKRLKTNDINTSIYHTTLKELVRDREVIGNLVTVGVMMLYFKITAVDDVDKLVDLLLLMSATFMVYAFSHFNSYRMLYKINKTHPLKIMLERFLAALTLAGLVVLGTFLMFPISSLRMIGALGKLLAIIFLFLLLGIKIPFNKDNKLQSYTAIITILFVLIALEYARGFVVDKYSLPWYYQLITVFTSLLVFSAWSYGSVKNKLGSK